MKRLTASLAGLALAMAAWPTLVSASLVLGVDNASASAYADGWTSGDNGAISGSAFGDWTLSSDAGTAGFAGFFIGDSTFLNPGNTGANINASGASFGLFANQDGGAFATASRNFSSPLSIGDTFSLDVAVNFRNGNKGFNLFDGGTQIFNFNVGSDDYVVNDAATGLGSIGNAYDANTAFTLSFTQSSLVGGTWQIVRSGGLTDLDSGTYNGLASGFSLYNSGTDGGDQNNFFANNMSITAVPEPSSFAMVFCCGGAALVYRRRKLARR
jgi:hypothetical protein